jgi:LETM1 and EF-hand domain-containing protein 1
LKQRVYAPHIAAANKFAVVHFSNLPPKGDDQPPPDTPPEKKSLATTIKNGVKGAWDSTVNMVKNPKETWQMVKDVANHYWLGSKLLWSDIKVAWEITRRVSQGHSMTRRERLQLIRTSSDIFRLVPFSVFIIVPFMELLLPLALKLFPNMLPSTFQVICL